MVEGWVLLLWLYWSCTAAAAMAVYGDMMEGVSVTAVA